MKKSTKSLFVLAGLGALGYYLYTTGAFSGSATKVVAAPTTTPVVVPPSSSPTVVVPATTAAAAAGLGNYFRG